MAATRLLVSHAYAYLLRTRTHPPIMPGLPTFICTLLISHRLPRGNTVDNRLLVVVASMEGVLPSLAS